LSIGRKLPIADPSTKELEGCIPVRIGVKKLKSSIIPGRGKLIGDGLIRRKTRTSTSGKRGNGARLFKKESKKEGSALEEPRTEAGGDPDKAGVASEG
jgi:hypothetical protein